MKRMWITALVMGITLAAGGAYASDGHGHGHGHGKGKGKDNPKRQCVADAAAVKKQCKQVCQDDFLAAVDTCKGVNHDCAEAARDARDACVTDVVTALRTCIEDSCSVFDDLIAQCRADFPPLSVERKECIDGAQVQKFQCRDDCRDSVQVFAGLKVCRDEFRADLRACAAEPTPLPND